MTETHRETLRARFKQQRDGTGRAWRKTASGEICRILAGSGVFDAATDLGLYLAHGPEPDLNPLMQHAWKAGKRTWVPVIERDGAPRMRFASLSKRTPLTRNRFGICEPTEDARAYLDPSQLDVVLVPLVAFDRCGNRLGMGGGYYDRCFAFRHGAEAKRFPRLCGVAFAFQETAELSPSKWDVPLDMVVTEEALIHMLPDGRQTLNPGGRN